MGSSGTPRQFHSQHGMEQPLEFEGLGSSGTPEVIPQPACWPASNLLLWCMQVWIDGRSDPLQERGMPLRGSTPFLDKQVRQVDEPRWRAAASLLPEAGRRVSAQSGTSRCGRWMSHGEGLLLACFLRLAVAVLHS
jgi:hypothetical protein